MTVSLMLALVTDTGVSSCEGTLLPEPLVWVVVASEEMLLPCARSTASVAAASASGLKAL